MALATPPNHDIPLSLALAVVASSSAPILLLDGDARVIAASTSFCRAFALDAGDMVDRSMSELGGGEWASPKLAGLLEAVASGYAKVEAYEMDLHQAGGPVRRLVLNVHKLDYGEAAVRLLLSVSDVTDARIAEQLKDQLVREKDVLLREVQHRVANSLQIIASVLLQSARTVQSAETKTHLQEAHNRVMSIAAVQQQLATSRIGEVELRPYFTQLCRSLGASMIHDPKQTKLNVNVDDSRVAGDVSVSLGLIVTELVINALKHAYPNCGKGVISVEYVSKGPNWTLSVRDDGVGMGARSVEGKAGLGTSIVEALAAQLKARIEVRDARPGTAVSLVHAVLSAAALPTQQAI